jgi:hypothetical protein
MEYRPVHEDHVPQHKLDHLDQNPQAFSELHEHEHAK